MVYGLNWNKLPSHAPSPFIWCKIWLAQFGCRTYLGLSLVLYVIALYRPECWFITDLSHHSIPRSPKCQGVPWAYSVQSLWVACIYQQTSPLRVTLFGFWIHNMQAWPKFKCHNTAGGLWTPAPTPSPSSLHMHKHTHAHTYTLSLHKIYLMQDLISSVRVTYLG